MIYNLQEYKKDITDLLSNTAEFPDNSKYLS